MKRIYIHIDNLHNCLHVHTYYIDFTRVSDSCEAASMEKVVCSYDILTEEAGNDMILPTAFCYLI